MQEFESIIGYKFNNSKFLDEALTHPSYNSNNKNRSNYEKLEFLGDAVLNLLITEMLIEVYNNDSEGNLAKRKAFLISGKVLAEIAVKLEIGKFILMDKGEESSGGRENIGNLENVLEAILGAIYMDGGIEPVKKFIKANWQQKLLDLIDVPENPKTLLQEWSQAQGFGIPKYKVISVLGPDHAPQFQIEVKIGSQYSAIAEGSSKKIAEVEAANLLINKIDK